jgi:hypothetical protein
VSDSLVLRCSCGTEYLDIDLFVDADDFDGYINFICRYGPHRRLRERLRAALKILTGQEHIFHEVILTRDDAEKVRDYLASVLGQTIHIDFTSVSTSSGWTPSTS